MVCNERGLGSFSIDVVTLQRDERGIGGSSVTVVAGIGCDITHLRTCKRATGLLRCSISSLAKL